MMKIVTRGGLAAYVFDREGELTIARNQYRDGERPVRSPAIRRMVAATECRSQPGWEDHYWYFVE